jgi:predicted alpha-1,6-mannanase (GH76 family)
MRQCIHCWGGKIHCCSLSPESNPSWLAHLAVQLPPQSTSVSSAFITPSEQVAAEQVGVAAAVSHTLDSQSLLLLHWLASAQGPQSGPPQSTSVSSAFITPSEQVAAEQVGVAAAVSHTMDSQSLLLLHWLASAQGPQSGPPQSTSVSSAFITPSEQVAAEQVGVAAAVSHTLDSQSLLLLHWLASAQGPPDPRLLGAQLWGYL